MLLVLLCTDAFLLYGLHLHSGRVDPVELVPTWTLDRRRTDLPRQLQEALNTGTIRRSLPQDLGNPHVIVNSAAFRLRVVEEEATALQMRVVVETRYRQTPFGFPSP